MLDDLPEKELNYLIFDNSLFARFSRKLNVIEDTVSPV